MRCVTRLRLSIICLWNSCRLLAAAACDFRDRTRLETPRLLLAQSVD